MILQAAQVEGNVPWVILGYLDDAPDAPLSRLGLPHVGRLSGSDSFQASYILGTGYPEQRRAWEAQVASRFLGASAPAIHPSAAVASSASLGLGATVHAGSVIGHLATIGRHAHVSANAIIAHEARVGPFSSVMPSASLGGGVIVGKGAQVGMGAMVLPGLSIGDGASVGAGAVVTRNVAPGACVVGTPARPI